MVFVCDNKLLILIDLISLFVFEIMFSYVVLMPNKRQALVEYEDMGGSCNAVTYANDNQVYIAGRPCYINYSTSQKISRPGDSGDAPSVNHILLFTIMNPIYPITSVSFERDRNKLLMLRTHPYLKTCLLFAGCLVHYL